jgi:hypothetical protein
MPWLQCLLAVVSINVRSRSLVSPTAATTILDLLLRTIGTLRWQSHDSPRRRKGGPRPRLALAG